MTLKHILLHVDDSQACPIRIDAAVELARSQGAHLTGLYVSPQVTIPIYAEAQIGPEILQAQRDAAQTRTEIAETVFREKTDGSGLNVEWRNQEGELSRTLNLHARYTDLVITGQVDKQDPTCPDTRLPEKVVLESGRPILVIPYIGASRPIGRRILVAWNGTREAVRALNDALPLMAQAETVEVVAVNPVSGEEGHGEIPCADICLHLARHGVSAEAHALRAEDVKVGDALLSWAADRSTDLIVMGAYGHSRFREMVLSGVSRHIFRHMTVPVLMSH